MKTAALGTALLVMWLIGGGSPADPRPHLSGHDDGAVYAASAITESGVPAATHTEVVQRYCVVCHNDGMLTGNLSLQGFDTEKAAERAETTERMIRKLRAGMMPPPGAPRPTGDTLL